MILDAEIVPNHPAKKSVRFLLMHLKLQTDRRHRQTAYRGSRVLGILTRAVTKEGHPKGWSNKIY